MHYSISGCVVEGLVFCVIFWIVYMRIEASGFTCAVTCTSVFFESPEDLKPIARANDIEDALPTKVLEDNQCSTSSTSTSSIGKNSDLSSERSMEDEDSGENEAQSAYKGPLDMMDSLEEVLPIRYIASPLFSKFEFLFFICCRLNLFYHFAISFPCVFVDFVIF